MKIRNLIPALFISFLFFSCNKEKKANEITCQNISNITLLSNSPVTIGKTIYFGTQEVGGYRIYSWTGPNYYTNQYPADSIPNAQLQNEGWYYLNLTGADGSCKRIDSIYIDVKLEQGTPGCTVNTNTTNYNNL